MPESRAIETPAEIVQRCIDLTREAHDALEADREEAGNLLVAVILNLGTLAQLLEALPG
jgi:hypothetical protein